jgi:hypothetical protein
MRREGRNPLTEHPQRRETEVIASVLFNHEKLFSIADF